MTLGLMRRVISGLVLGSVVLAGGCGSLRAFDRFESGFNAPNWREAWRGGKFEPTVAVVRADDRSLGFEPSMDGKGGNALCIKIAKGGHQGTHELEYNFAKHGYLDPSEATASYLMRFAQDFRPAQGGKMPGFAGTYGVAGWGNHISNGSNGWSARSMHYPSPNGEPIRLASLCYLANMKERGGKSQFYDWHESGVPRFERDRWYHIIQYVRMNSVVDGKGVADGVLRVYVDGKLAVNQTKVVYRNTEDLKIDRFWFDVYYGGDPAPHDMHLFIDEVVIRAGPVLPKEKPGTSEVGQPVPPPLGGYAVPGFARPSISGFVGPNSGSGER